MHGCEIPQIGAGLGHDAGVDDGRRRRVGSATHAFHRRRHEHLAASSSQTTSTWFPIATSMSGNDDRVVVAITFDTLVNERLDAASLSEIDGSWLAVAYG